MKTKDYGFKSFIIAFVLIVISWQFLAMLLEIPIFPTPTEIFINICEIFKSKILIHIAYSLKRIILGIALTLFIGTPLGILMGYYEKVDLLLSPILYFNYPVPKMALLPIIMLIFGLGDSSKIVMIFLITFFPVVVNIRDGIKEMGKEIFYPLYSLGASDFQMVKEVILPGIIPRILTSLRIVLGTAISVLFFTENFGTEYGLGYFIMDAWMRVNYVEMYSGIVIISILGLLLFMFIDIVERVTCKWQ